MLHEQKVISLGKKKKTVATCTATRSSFSIRVNHVPYDMLQNKLLKSKLKEIILVVGYVAIADISFDITCESNSPTASVYAVRQSFARSIIAFYKKHFDEAKAMEFMRKLVAHDKSTLVTDSRRTEPKKFGGPGARARYQKSYR